MAYFDNNSTTPPFSSVLESVAHAQRESWANPSSPHLSGTRVRVLLDRARKEIAEFFSVQPQQVTFTSGATESNNAVLSWASRLKQGVASSALVSAIEHPSILEASQFYFGKNLYDLPVDQSGLIDIQKCESILDQKLPDFVSLMAVHNETGVIQPWQEVAQLCKKHGIWYHCDATQWVGKMDPSGLDLCSSFSFSAHKFGGVKGAGVLISKKPVSWIKGGGQEMETRGGTENFPAIEGIRVALNQVSSMKFSRHSHQEWKDDFEKKLKNKITGIRIIGEGVPRLWNTSLLCLPKFENHEWISKLDKLGHAVSTGSACSTAREQPSALSGSIGLNVEESRRLIRVSSLFETKQDDWLQLAESFGHALEELEADYCSRGVVSL